MKRFTAFSFFLLFSIAAHSQVIYLKAELGGSQEVPSNASTANGIAIVIYDPSTRLLKLIGDYQNLSAIATASHIHSPAAPGSNAPVLITLTNTGGISGTISGSGTLTVAQETDLLGGNMYVNVLSSIFPGGEIRGQLTTTTTGQTDHLTARIQGAQEVPPTASVAIGNATLLIDKTTGMVYLTGSFSGLISNISSAHIYAAAPNETGPVIIPLVFTSGTSGTIHVASAITPGNQAQMLAGNTYVNIHSSAYPGGEIRGQLIAESQLVYLKAILQGSQEVPPNASLAKGTVIVKYNKTLKSLELKGDYQNLSSPITGSHIHSPAPPGTNAGVLFTLSNTGSTLGTLSTNVTLTTGQEADLLAGLMYVNVHSATFPAGEIRGQLTSTSANQTYYLAGKFSGSQESPPNSSTATGNVIALLDRSSREVFLTGNFSGFATSPTASHIHRGSAGENGPVVLSLSMVTGVTAGVISGNGVVSASVADSMILGFTYTNIHSTTFPSGEIRAQFGNQVLPVKLAYFSGYKQNNEVILIWESEQELNLRHYEIEQQSIETGGWISKGIVAAKKINTTAKYSFADIPLVNNTAFVLYRLKMVDMDGQQSYSNTIRLNFIKSSPALAISTNPVFNDMLQFVITGLPTNKKAIVSIIDYSGKVVMKTTASNLMINGISIGNLAAGMYILVVDIDGIVLQKGFIK